MPFDFDRLIDRQKSNSIKWKQYPEDVLPLWVADMDFASPEPVQAALMATVREGVFGYEYPSKDLLETVASRLERLYGWQIPAEAVIATPGVVAGILAATRTVCRTGEGVLIQPPVYPPFHRVHEADGLVLQKAELGCRKEGRNLVYEIDWDALQAAFNSSGSHTGMFLLCHPHNPTGQVYSPKEMMRIADLCERNGTFLCSDEIHAELTLGNARHIPPASLDPSIADRTITLIAPSKTFNIPGLFCGFAVITNPELRRRFKKTVEGLAMHSNNLGMVAAQAAYSGACDAWLDALRAYLTGNRDWLNENLPMLLPGCRFTVPAATYLLWLDCGEYIASGRMEGSPHHFFLNKARVALNDGAEFGSTGKEFVRLNFGCPRSTLMKALKRMEASLA